MSVVLATGGYDHKIRFWEATSGACTRTLLFGDSQVNCLVIANDKSILAAGGNPQMQLFDVRSMEEKPILNYDCHTNNVTAVGFQKDGKWLYSGSEDGNLRLFDTRSNKASRTYDCGCAVNTVVLHPNQMELITGDQNGVVKIWDLEADKCREEYSPIIDVAIRSISIAADASVVTVGCHSGHVFVYNILQDQKTWELAKTFEAHPGNYLLKCVLSPDLESLVTTSSDKTLKVWDTRTWELERVLAGHQRWVWDAVFSSDSQFLVSVSSDQSGKLWDMTTGEVVRTYTGHNLTVSCVALNDIA